MIMQFDEKWIKKHGLGSVKKFNRKTGSRRKTQGSGKSVSKARLIG
jgi:hypothetical protein